jgi:hypothetical protein
LQDFLLTWANPETNPEETATMLHNKEKGGAYYSTWLSEDLLAAANSGQLTPQSMTRLTGLGFDDQEEVEDWLKKVWPVWFDKPYPSQ